jgi:hypothetical protein
MSEELKSAPSKRVNDPELLAMSEIVSIMASLDDRTAARVSLWFAERYGERYDA